MKIVISKLPNPEQCGDWHDKPLRWAVTGPGDELQKFSTKADATAYKRTRRHTRTASEAHVAFVLGGTTL